jgi:putative transposase
MSRANPLWGAPRIHGELLKLGIGISQAVFSKYMVRHRKPPSQNWRTFLENHAKDIVSLDLFTVPKAPSAAWTGRQVVEAFPWETAPRFLLRDRDGIYGTDFVRRVTGLGIEQVVISARSPWQSPYVERVIGSRTHLGLGKECPETRPVEPLHLGVIRAEPMVGGLHHRYFRRAA